MWDYKKGFVNLAMPTYVNKALKQFKHMMPSMRQDSQYPYVPLKYGSKTQ